MKIFCNRQDAKGAKKDCLTAKAPRTPRKTKIIMMKPEETS